MTKTETAILAKVASNGGCWSAECYHGQGNQGGKLSGGWREFKAALNLIERGILVETHRLKGTTWMGNGYQVSSTIIRFKLVGG